eukprot:COSAG01_NODE_49665_length_370_cov_0.760148_1_plen_23_part_10
MWGAADPMGKLLLRGQAAVLLLL